MPKTNLNDIFKNGDNFKLTDVDWNSPEIRKRFRGVKEQQEKSLARKKIDWDKLNTFYITI
jgi:hypothetical protein